MSKISESWSTHQQIELSYISKFTADIQHVQGKDNLVADTLSRATINDVQLGINYHAMAAAQQQDTEVQAYCTTTSSLQLEDISFGTQGIMLLCDTCTCMSNGHARSTVPANTY